MDQNFHFESSRNGQVTCSFQGKYLHSKYNPEGEGERFAESLEADFSPLCVFIIEPALSYCAKALKNRFPAAILCAIHFTKVFKDYDSDWDFVFYLDRNEMTASLSEDLFDALGEEKLCSSLVYDWIAAKQSFPEDNLLAWTEIKKAIIKARGVIATRAYFSKRWTKNAILFASNIQKPLLLKNGKCPLVITASGPSLSSSLPFLKKYRDSFFLLALSSSYMPLTHYGLKPDLVISSDGGFWAKKHLCFPGQKNSVFALECESAVPGNIFLKAPVISLAYPDGPGKELLKAAKIPFVISQRNGTVAGTALDFAMEITSGNIYFCGLDQAPSPALQHTQPNNLEIDNSKKDFRLRTSETRNTVSRFNSEQSLSIYRNWFKSNSKRYAKRVFRLSDNYKYDFTLGEIQDIGWEVFQKKESQTSKIKPEFTESKIITKTEERNSLIQNKLLEISRKDEFINEVFPMESIIIKRQISNEEKENRIRELNEKMQDFLQECKKLLK